MYYPVLTTALKRQYHCKSPSTPRIVLNRRCIFPPRGYTKFKCRGLCVMGMYEKVKLSHIYTKFRYADKYFQLGERPYYKYEDAILRTMNEFSEKAIEMERS